MTRGQYKIPSSHDSTHMLHCLHLLCLYATTLEHNSMQSHTSQQHTHTHDQQLLQQQQQQQQQRLPYPQPTPTNTHTTTPLADAASAEAAAAKTPARLSELENRRWRLAFPAVQHITAHELKRRLREVDHEWPPVLVDCRSAAEYAASTIPGSIRPNDIDPVATGAIVCFCTVGMRSSLEAQRLRSMGRNAFSMDGILAWLHAGGEICVPSSGEPTRRVHVFSRQLVRCLPPDVEPVWFSTGATLAESVRLLFGHSSARIPALLPFLLAALWRRTRMLGRAAARLLRLRNDPFA